MIETHRLRTVVAVAFALALSLTGGARAATLQPVGHFAQPIYVTSDPAQPDRLFVVEREGQILQVWNGAVSTFADLRPVVGCCEGESGLLSIALSPDFGSSGRLYAFYTDEGAGSGAAGNIHIAELRASGAGAPLSSLRDVVAEIPHPDASHHYGGQLQIGPDGMLYAAIGDGGVEPELAQDPGSPLGKLLRIDPNQALAQAGVWASGLRNPFRFSFDRAGGALLIGDVGDSRREEVDRLPAPPAGAGANFGWPCWEGSLAASSDGACADRPPDEFTAPVFEYPHNELGRGIRQGIIGGYVVRDPSLGELYGRYLYGDLGNGEIRSLNLGDPFGSDRWEGMRMGSLVSFGEDSCGRVYVVSRGGAVSRLTGAQPARCGAPAPPPAIQQQATFVRIRAATRKVKRRKHALISVWVSPCQGRRGDPVTLWKGRKRVGFRRLSRACSAHFRPRITRRAGFRARVPARDDYLAAVSRRLTIKPLRKLR